MLCMSFRLYFVILYGNTGKNTTIIWIPFLVPFHGKQTNDGAPPKKKKNKQNPTKGDQIKANQKKPVVKTVPAAPPTQRKPLQNGTPETQKKPEGEKQFVKREYTFIQKSIFVLNVNALYLIHPC